MTDIHDGAAFGWHPLLRPQAKERLAVRKARPSRENIADEVEAALAREVAHLAGVTAQLADKVRGAAVRSGMGVRRHGGTG